MNHRGCRHEDGKCCDTEPLVFRKMKRGDTLLVPVQVRQSPVPGVPPQPVNITGWKMWFTAKMTSVAQDPQAVAQITTTTSTPAGGTIDFYDPTAGQALITMPPLATVGFPDGLVLVPYDVQVEDLLSRIFTVEEGILLVKPDLTRAIS